MLIKTAEQFPCELYFMHSSACLEYLQLQLACEITSTQNKLVEINYHKDYEIELQVQNTLCF